MERSIVKEMIFKAGVDAYKNGKNINDNPFNQDTKINECWKDGFIYVQKYREKVR